ncbi:MAG: DUF4476 domain-containing protein [Sphingobacteriaceae bacterium]
MIIRTVFLVLLCSLSLAQNSLIIFSSSGNKFSVKGSEIIAKDTFYQEARFTNILKDTLNLTFKLEDGSVELNRLIYLLEKAKPVKNKEFIYSLELNTETKKLKLVFVTANDVKPLPDPLLPPKPKEDTTYKWRNNVYGNLFELKDGKPSFFYNVPKNGTCIQAMPNENVDYALKLIARTQINTEKYSFAREVLKSNCISCQQYADLMKGINFEIDKLKLFKEAYLNITDKNNVAGIQNQFKFESSKKEFNDIISNPNKIIVKNKINCMVAVHDSIPFALIKNLKLFTTDHEKYQYMKEKGSEHCYTTMQFKNILSVFLHDREKLDLTKQFYTNITDKENLKTLKDIFSYQETNANLLDFLKQTN